MTYADTVKFLVAMIIIMNPLGSLSIFLQLTHKYPLFYQRKSAITCGIAVAVLMLLTLWSGSQFLDLMGITIASFRFAGGIILLLMGLSMLQSKESPISHTPEDDIAAIGRESVAIVPMALPTIVGPGTLSTLIIAANDFPNVTYKIWFSILSIFLALGMGLLLYYGNSIVKLVGQSVINVITRIMGMIIMSIAVGMLANGLIDLIPAFK